MVSYGGDVVAGVVPAERPPGEERREEWRWVTSDPLPDDASEAGHGPIATLGPAGTSSEAAALALCRRLGRDPTHEVRLHRTYEDAHEALRRGDAAMLLVANAYEGVNEFYMDAGLRFDSAFVLDTPRYGIAAREDRPIPLRGSVATHPAPRSLIRQLMPPAYADGAVELAGSTSEAAQRAASGAVDLALTTESSVRRYGLRFVSRTHPIRMLWSVFVRADGHRRSPR